MRVRTNLTQPGRQTLAQGWPLTTYWPVRSLGAGRSVWSGVHLSLLIPNRQPWIRKGPGLSEAQFHICEMGIIVIPGCED